MPPKFRINDRVIGAPGRVSHGWTGIIKEVVKPKTEHPLPGKSGVQPESYSTIGGYRVWWKEREESEDKRVSKTPIIFMLEEHLTNETITIEARQAPPAEDRAEAWEGSSEEEDLSIGVF
jgi:hypothetical protein